MKRVPPRALRGFGHIQRSWRTAEEKFVARILPGEYYVTAAEELVSTTLGSCVSACIRDPQRKIGGMNHFMLPGTPSEHISGLMTESTRYGIHAMEHLINAILRHGGERSNLEVKIVGGGELMATTEAVGARNVEFVRNFLEREGLKIVGEDVGDTCARMVIYDPMTGKAKVKRLTRSAATAELDLEKSYQESIDRRPIEAGSVELF